MRIDVNAFVGSYPFRRLEGGEPESLLETMRHTAIDRAWVSHLAAVYWRDPTEGNDDLYRITARYPALRPVPAIHPAFANWEDEVARAAAARAPAVRIDAANYGVDPAGAAMAAACDGAAAAGLPVMMAVRLEDLRQRHPRDGWVDLTPAVVRGLLRAHPRLRLLVTHADREFIEQVHFGSTEAESSRLWWDICWLWGPPMDDFDHLVRTIGADRFCFGTGAPLRLAEGAAAKLDLLAAAPAERARIEAGNAERLAPA